MKNIKKIFLVLIVFLLVFSFSIYLLLNNEDKSINLNIKEKQWINEHKNSVIDMAVLNDVPIFNYDGKGVFFDFIESIEKEMGLSFNMVPYQYGDVSELKYGFKLIDKKSDNDISVYRDNYVLITKEKRNYTSLRQIEELVIGVLNEELLNAKKCFEDGKDISFIGYETFSNLFEAILSEEGELDAILIPKVLYLDRYFEHDDLFLAYNIIDMGYDYVISLGDDKRLNDILIKLYNKWSAEKFSSSYSYHFSNAYFKFNKINEKDIDNFRSKQYIYGFVENPPYDLLVNNKLLGYNKAFLKSFGDVSNVEIVYKKYQDEISLLKAFENKEVDLIMNNSISDNHLKTISLLNTKLVVVADMDKNLNINSLHSLIDYNLMVVNNDVVANYLEGYNLKLNKYNNGKELLSNYNENFLLIFDKESYNYYVKNKLNNTKIYYEKDIGSNYNFIINDDKANKLFYNYFDFYLSFVDSKKIINDSYASLFVVDKKPIILKTLFVIITFLSLGFIIFVIRKFKTRKKGKILIVSKENKMKYIDQLTSLKNRAYLNENLDIWDECEVYPQTIIILDLNNLSYINDNFGHGEGDKVITEAANILIKLQIEKSEIIRTSGNEFLVYLIGRGEKEVVEYIKLLQKEFVNLTHGFGVAIGYSMIVDPIKMVDDAINEATANMRENKEEKEIK